MWSALRSCLSVYFDLSPRGMPASSSVVATITPLEVKGSNGLGPFGGLRFEALKLSARHRSCAACRATCAEFAMPELIEIAIRSYSDDCVAYRRRDRSPMVCSYDQAMSLALDLLDQSPA